MSKDVLYPLRRLHGMLHEAKARYELRKKYRDHFHEHPNSVFLVLTPEHGNLGDHAIASAETDLLRRLGIDYIEITGRKLEEMKWNNQLSVMNGYPIFINGGGNLGTLWLDVEDLQRQIIQKNPRSSIAILPNTIFYENSEWGRKEFENSVRLYNRHKKLHLYARENTSYEMMRKVYRNVKLVPDMVLSLNKCRKEKTRHGCLLCLRSDCEKTRTDEQEQIIRSQASLLFGEAVADTDMIAKGGVSVAEREAALQAKYDQFASAELVITDRLHGMIFCAITGTPCIVANSKSPKVRGCYEWIKDLDYIRFVDDVSLIAEGYRQIPQTEHKYENSHLQKYYAELEKDILSIV